MPRAQQRSCSPQRAPGIPCLSSAAPLSSTWAPSSACRGLESDCSELGQVMAASFQQTYQKKKTKSLFLLVFPEKKQSLVLTCSTFQVGELAFVKAARARQ